MKSFKFLEGLSKWMGVLSSAITFVMMVLVTISIIARFVFNNPIIGVVETTELLMVVVIYLGLAYVQLNHGHITVEVVVSKLSKQRRLPVTVFSLLISIVFFGLLTWYGGEEAYDSVRINEVTGGSYIPMYPSKIALAFGSLIMTIMLLSELIQMINNLILVKANKGIKI